MRHRAGRFDVHHHAVSRDPMAAMLCPRSTRVGGEWSADGNRQPGGNENRRYSVRDVRKVVLQGTVVMLGPASEIASAVGHGVWGPPRERGGSRNRAVHASSIDGPSAPPPSPGSVPTI